MLGHRHGKGEDRVSIKQANVIRDVLRRDVEDDLLFKASDVSRSSRQYWSDISEGDRRHRYKQFKGWESKEIRNFLVGSAKKLVFEVSFLAFRVGVPEKQIHNVVEQAFARHVASDPLK